MAWFGKKDNESTQVRPWWGLQADWELRGNFNVEGGSASFATQIFQDEDERDDGSANFVETMSGGGDGVYPVFRLLDEQGHRTGAIAMFEERWAVGSENHTVKPADLVDGAMPVLAGFLDVTDIVYVSDSYACTGDSNAIVDIELPAGRYHVIAWLAEMDILKQYNMEPFTRPIALGVYCSQLATALTTVIAIDARPETVASLLGDNNPFATVMANKERRWADALRYNAREDAERGEDERSLSWSLQAAVHGDESALFSRELLDSTNPLDIAKRRRLLAMRGQFDED